MSEKSPSLLNEIKFRGKGLGDLIDSLKPNEISRVTIHPDAIINIIGKCRNQTLEDVLKIIEQITNRDGDINVYQLKEEIKKIQSQGKVK